MYTMYMVGAFSILRTTLFLTRTFVLVQPARARLELMEPLHLMLMKMKNIMRYTLHELKS